MTDLDLGTAVAAICAYNVLGFDDEDRLLPDAPAVLAQAAAEARLIAAGGIEVVHGGRVVLSPGCCCGLEHWREWITFAEGGRPADSGHQPPPLVERLPSGILRIGYESAPDAAVEIPAEELRGALRAVESDLAAFVTSLAEWAGHRAPASAAAFAAVIDRAFSLTSRPAAPPPMPAPLHLETPPARKVVRDRRPIHQRLEAAAASWAERGRPLDDLWTGTDAACAWLWLHSEGGKRTGVSTAVMEFVRAGYEAMGPDYDRLLGIRDDCRQCGMTWKVDSLGLCCTCGAGTCPYCRPSLARAANGNQLCPCGGEVVG
jgi:hypothetical protein